MLGSRVPAGFMRVYAENKSAVPGRKKCFMTLASCEASIDSILTSNMSEAVDAAYCARYQKMRLSQDLLSPFMHSCNLNIY